MKVVLMGTPEFAVSPLLALIENGYEVAGVFTQPDKPVGRKAVLTPPPVKVAALEHGIPVFQPASLKGGEGAALLKPLSPDVVIVVAYGKILPDDCLSLPKYGCINIHGSLLPKFRGAAPIQRSILEGEAYAGVTTIQMDSGIDTGDMLLQEKLLIRENETSAELYERLAVLGAKVLLDTLEALKTKTLQPVRQDDAKSTYAPMLDKSMSPVDWSDTAFRIHKKICALNPWPVAVTTVDGKVLKLYTSRLGGKASGVPGTVHPCKDGLRVTCGDGEAVLLCEVQYEGKKRMHATDFLRGHPLAEGSVL